MSETKDNIRRIISNNEFLDYKKVLGKDNLETVEFTLVLLKQYYGFSTTEISSIYDYSEEDFVSELNESNIDFFQLSEEQFFSKLSDNKKEIFKQLAHNIVSRVKPEKLKELISSDELLSVDIDSFNNYLDELEKEKQEIFKILSTSDLSQILPKSFFDCDFLDKINLENSGARLDMENFNYDARVSGSLKGCELLSFSINHYIDPDASELLSMWSHISADCLDESQYIAVAQYYLLHGLILSEKEHFLFQAPNIQDELQLLYEKVLKDNKYSAYGYLNLYNCMTPEAQAKNSAYIDRIITLAKNSDDKYSIEKSIQYMSLSQFDKYFPDILKLYTNADGTMNLDNFISMVWGYCNSEVQLNYFEKFKDIINQTATNNNKDFYVYRLLESSSEEAQKVFLQNLLEESRTNGGALSLSKVDDILSHTSKNVDISDDYFEEILSLVNPEKYSSVVKFYNVWQNIGLHAQQKYLPTMLNHLEIFNFVELWNRTDLEAQKNLYNELIPIIEKDYPSLEHQFKGDIYISLLKNMPEKDASEWIHNDVPKFIDAFRKKYNDNEKDFIDYSKYTDFELANILLQLENSGDLNDSNINSILNNLPTLGKQIIYRVINCNSKMIQNEASKILSKLAQNPKNAGQLLTEIENIFAQRNLPDFVKFYKYFELLQYDDKINFSSSYLSPALANTQSKTLSKRIIFSDLMRISMDSNNKSMKNFVDTLERGNALCVKVMNNQLDVQDFSNEDRFLAQEYTKTLYFLYELSDASVVDKKDGRKLSLTGDIKQDFESLGRRYSHDGLIKNLPDQILRSIIGPYQELFEGIDSVEKIKEYMHQKIETSNKRHFELADSKIDLKPGDLVKGIKDSSRVSPSLVSDGIRAGEFLGVDSHSDLTPLDTDFSAILPGNEGQGFIGKLNNTMSASYGDMFFVVKYNPAKMEYSRQNDDLNVLSQEIKMSDKISSRNEPDTIIKRINDRSRNEYDAKKLEIFSSKFSGEHYGIRTGVGITDIDYIVLTSGYNKRLGFELAMNGTYIPVFDAKSEELLFSPEDYESIRSQMQGLSFYDAGNFVVDESAKTAQAKEIVDELFSTGDVDESISEKEAKSKRSAIQYQVVKALSENMGIGLENHVTGNMTEGFVEFIDTGSTGRGTNVPGSGDFDFMMKVDKNIIDNPSRMEEFKTHLRKVLAIPSNDPETSTEELGGNFRYKKVSIEGIAEPVDIDVTFAPKNEEITYSTDMCVKDRLNHLKTSDPEGYKYTVANIVLAKRLLKKEGLYKKHNSDGATQYGGFGGVGVENWILQNGGSLITAMDSFLEASAKTKEFDEFKELYPIFDFGENHASKGSYPHDTFINGLTQEGYLQMKTRFRELKNELTSIEVVSDKTRLAETIIEDTENLAKDARKGSVLATMSELTNLYNEIENPSITNKEVNDYDK